MNKQEAILIAKKIRGTLDGMMDVLYGEEYSEGYRQAITDMVKVFNEAPIDPDFEAERKAMFEEIKQLKAENAALKQEVDKNQATIQKMLPHVNIVEVLGAETKKQEEPKAHRRGVAFIFK